MSRPKSIIQTPPEEFAESENVASCHGKAANFLRVRLRREMRNGIFNFHQKRHLLLRPESAAFDKTGWKSNADAFVLHIEKNPSKSGLPPGSPNSGGFEVPKTPRVNCTVDAFIQALTQHAKLRDAPIN